MAEPAAPRPGPGDLLDELERLVPKLPTTTLVELAAQLDRLSAEPAPQLGEVEATLALLLERR
ncbi:MAG: hypothetical protein ABR541_01880 [Candidatus Dormibacteria bacterium]